MIKTVNSTTYRVDYKKDNSGKNVSYRRISSSHHEIITGFVGGRFWRKNIILRGNNDHGPWWCSVWLWTLFWDETTQCTVQLTEKVITISPLIICITTAATYLVWTGIVDNKVLGPFFFKETLNGDIFHFVQVDSVASLVVTTILIYSIILFGITNIELFLTTLCLLDSISTKFSEINGLVDEDSWNGQLDRAI